MKKNIFPVIFLLVVSFTLSAQTWIQQGAGFTTSSRGIMNFSCVSSQVIWASAYDGSGGTVAVQDFTRTINGGTTWTAGIVNNASGLQISMITAIDANTAWVAMYLISGSNPQGIYKTTNGGSTWTRQTTAYFNNSASFPDWIYFWDANNGVCVGDPISSPLKFEIYTTTNGGTTWTAIPASQNPTAQSGEYGFTANYAVNGNSCWFGTSQGRIYASSDRGYHWTVTSVPNMSAYDVMPAFCSTSNGLALKTNSGTSLTDLLGVSTNGGTSFTALSYSGTLFTYNINYVPQTTNTYATAGLDYLNQSDRLGISWSYNGGLTWDVDQYLWGTQITATGFIDANTGWAGSYNTGTTDGIYKMTQGGNTSYLPPSNLHATVNGYNIHLTWDAPPGTPGPGGYNVYLSGYLLTSTPDPNLYYDISFGDGTYYFSVYSVYGSTQYGGVGPVLAMVGTATLLVGDSQYDLQTNGSMQDRFYMYGDGTMGAAWIYGTSYSSFPERGTGYNYQNGGGWNSTPTSRIEAERTGWPSYQPWNNTGEIVIAHQSSYPQLVISTRTTRGTGSWTESYISPPSGAPGLNWPHMITSGPTNNYIHMLVVTTPTASGGGTYNGQDGALLYYRSLDGGVTWDEAGVILNELNSSYYPGFSADNYAWGSPHGDTLVFAVGGWYRDVFIMKSTDNGTTWSKVPILNNGYIWHNEGEYLNPFTGCDGSLCVEMDHQGRYHVVFGRMKLADYGSGTLYWPETDGLVYWNSDMPMLNDSLDLSILEANGQLMGYVQSNSTGDTIVGIPNYGVGLCSFPQITVDNDNKIFVIWSGVTVGNPSSDDKNFRHIWGRASVDLGTSWGDMIDLTATPMDVSQEFVYPSIAKNSDGSLHMLYQNATVPGSAVKDYPVTPHYCMFFHRSVPKSLFPVAAPVNAPVTTVSTFYACPNSATAIPVTVNNFSAIKSMSLRIEYDPAILTFDLGTSSINALLSGATIANLPVGGSSALDKIMITWTGSSPQTLSNGVTLAILGFNYTTGISVLSFNNIDNGGQDCEYTNASGNPMNDSPTSVYFIDGVVSAAVIGGTVTGGSAIIYGGSTGTLTLAGYAGNIYGWQEQYNGGGYTDISGTTGLSTYSEVPVYTGTWDYRAVLQNGSCPLGYSSPTTVVVETPPGTPKTWIGSTGDDWISPTNWSPPGIPFLTDDVIMSAHPTYMPVVRDPGLGCNNLTISPNGTVTVAPGIILTINGEVIIQ
ncbi:MAG: hypothetical protein NTX61_15140 [Bacteroidetes bacterium]|nr:hypothetical protein [Bacteroidota bacterium]